MSKKILNLNGWYIVSPDSVKLGLADNNTPMAVIKNKNQAHKFGKMMWNKFYTIEELNNE